MAENRKSIIDEAFLESEQIEKAFKANAKEILAQTMGSEIEEMVKESLEGSNGLTEDEDEEMDLDLDLDLDDEGDEDMDIDAGGAGELDLELGDMEDMDMDDEDMEMDDEDFEVVDLTNADNETVVNVFKKMAPEDEIEVVQDNGDIEIKDNETGAEYKIELGGEMEMDDEDMDMDLDLDFEDEDMEMDDEDMEMDLDIEDEEEMDDDMNEEIVYEVEIETDEDKEESDDDMSEGDYMEEDLAGTRGYRGQKGKRRSATSRQPKTTNESFTPRAMKLIKENKVLKNNVSKVQSENEQLKEDYNKMVDALKQFRNKLNEVAVFNSNLTYAVRLFTENTTTKEEKVDIIKRFDDVKTLKESKNVYKQLVKEVSTKAPIKESIDKKLNVTKASGSAETKINESQVYVNPELEKMKKLWSYDYKK
jgi:hypothetical protein